MADKIPRDDSDDYTQEMIAARRRFAEEKGGAPLDTVGRSAIPPEALPGNIENAIGAAQVPIGLAGPLLIDGEHAKGELYVPLATTEGTLVASYSRGMRVIREAGGVRTTVIERYMQRAPVFHCADARQARALGQWLGAHEEEIRAAAEATTSVGRLAFVQRFVVGPKLFTRFNYTTGDAAGQNMSGKATLAACEWIGKNHPDAPAFTLSGATDTDKKHSHMNMLHSRGARVVAEFVLPDALAQERLKVDTATMFRARQVSNAGGMLAGTVNNGMHAANGLTALFIACGQDVANVAESHAAITYVDLRDNGDLYWSITIPSLIVATHGGGTGLPTASECLALMGCKGKGKALRLAEICAGTVLAGELSLAAAVLAGDWVTSHDRYGRNR
jgi:hydroxymethylglutaryl-CoA reductase (NADPH)